MERRGGDVCYGEERRVADQEGAGKAAGVLLLMRKGWVSCFGDGFDALVLVVLVVMWKKRESFFWKRERSSWRVPH